MNLFGNTPPGDGSNTLIRNISLAGACIAIGAIVISASLDNAARDGAWNKIAEWRGDKDLKARLAKMPRPSNEPGRVIGIRYGNVDYTTTAGVPGGKSRIKNVITDPSLGMPQ